LNFLFQDRWMEWRTNFKLL